MIGVLRSTSPFVNTTIAASGRTLGGERTNIMAILRDKHMLAPRADMTLLAGDRLILIASDSGLSQLDAHLEPW